MAPASERQDFSDLFYERLPEYLARLRLEGLIIDAEQVSRIALLLSRLESIGGMPTDADALARLVAPVLAGTPTQQKMCLDHLRSMFSNTVTDSIFDLSAKNDEVEERKTRIQRFVRSGIVRFVALLAIAAMIAVAALIYSKIDPTPPPTAAPQKFAEVNIGPEKLPEWIRNYPIKELELPKQSPWNRTPRWYYTEFGWEKSVAALLPWLIYVSALGGLIYLTLAHLRRESLRQNLPKLPLSFLENRPRFGDRKLLADLQPLRKLARDGIRVIDPEATAIASAAQGGLLTLRQCTLLVPVDFVIFIDRRSARDHLACYGEAMVDALVSCLSNTDYN